MPEHPAVNLLSHGTHEQLECADFLCSASLQLDDLHPPMPASVFGHLLHPLWLRTRWLLSAHNQSLRIDCTTAWREHTRCWTYRLANASSAPCLLPCPSFPSPPTHVPVDDTCLRLSFFPPCLSLSTFLLTCPCQLSRVIAASPIFCDEFNQN